MKDGEALCAICLRKWVARGYCNKMQKASRKVFENYPSKTTNIESENNIYFAVLIELNDIGQWFSGNKGNINIVPAKVHKEIS